MTTWKRRLTDKLPKLTKRELTFIIALLIIGGIMLFRTCTIKWNDKGFVIDSKTTLKVNKK